MNPPNQSWLREEAGKLINLIETSTDSELDKLLADAKFGSLADEKPFTIPKQIL